jgi:threonine/homoserine/homoserine lactone efflux protein
MQRTYKTGPGRSGGVTAGVKDLEALVVFSFVSSVTPGPNNALLWASGVQFGFRPTVPQILGAAAGIGLLAVAAAAGVGLVVTAVPGVELGLKLAGSAYLLLLAFRLAGSEALERGRLARPLGFRQAAAFQFLNPKAWLFALAAMSAFRSDEPNAVVGSGFVALTMTIVVIPAFTLWAGAGTALHGLAERGRAQRALSAALAVLLAASVAFIWV